MLVRNFLWIAVVVALAPDYTLGQSQPSPTEILDRAPHVQTAEQMQKSLASVRKVDDHPLYEMRFVGDYDAEANLFSQLDLPAKMPWGCSLFVAYGKEGNAYYGRNFDWQNNPALLLHTNPSNGYASISMVDVSYLGYSRKDEKFDSLDGRQALLKAPLIPFDGINEHGLTVGMAAVGNTKIPHDPEKPTVGSVQIIRLMLDQARTVDEALAIMQRYNIVGVGGPLIHYLIADAEGNSALVEQKDGQRHIHRNDTNWQSATNFYLTGEETPLQQCHRFAAIHRRMMDTGGNLSIDQTFALLKNVAQRETRWSVVYDLNQACAHVAMSRRFNNRHRFSVRSDPAPSEKAGPSQPIKK